MFTNSEEGQRNALDKIVKAGDIYKSAHIVKASVHDLREGDYAYLGHQLFLGKIKKCVGPYLVTKEINKQNVELQVCTKRTQIYSAYRIEKFVDPAK
jgi:hypothetical protein